MINNNKKINKRVKQLIEAVSRYIEENYIEIQSPDECTKAIEPFEVTVNECCEMYVGSAADQSEIPAAPMAVHAKAAEVDSSDLTEMLENLDAGFSETLLQLIDRTGVLLGLKFPCGGELEKLAEKVGKQKVKISGNICNVSKIR